jgi:hypothetical protein
MPVDRESRRTGIPVVRDRSRPSIRTWLVLAVVVWFVGTIVTFAESPPPTPRQALETIQLVLSNRVYAKAGMFRGDMSNATLRSVARETESLSGIHFSAVRVWKPMLGWMFVSPSWVARVTQTNGGAPPRTHYYALCGHSGGFFRNRSGCEIGYETSARGWFW